MRSDRITMALSFNGEQVATASVRKCYTAIENQRYRWVHTYGLTADKHWQIYIVIRSSMGKHLNKNKLQIKTDFKFITKQKANNENSSTISDFI